MTARRRLTAAGLAALAGLLAACGGARIDYPDGIWFRASSRQPFREVGWRRVHRLDTCPLAVRLPTGWIGPDQLSDRTALRKLGWQESGSEFGPSYLCFRTNDLTVDCEFDEVGGCSEVTVRVRKDHPPIVVAEVGDIQITLPASRTDLPAGLDERAGVRP